MPIRLLVRATDSDTFPDPGAFRKGDIIDVRPAGYRWGNLAQLPRALRIDISNTSDTTTGLGWLEVDIVDGAVVNRRKVRVDPAEVDALVAANAGVTFPDGTGTHATFTRQQFNSRVVTRQ